MINESKHLKQFQQIYLEITNICNLSCPFCRIDSRAKGYMNYQDVIDYVNDCTPYTDSFYLHLKGEPLLHPELGLILDYLDSKNIKTKITTNGTLLNKKGDLLLKHKNIKHINISLQSYLYLTNEEKKIYRANLISFLNKVTDQYIYLRNWVADKELEEELCALFHVEKLRDKEKLSNHIIYSMQNEFTWPNDEKEQKPNGPCLGGKKQLGILVNGDVVLCCLDDEGKTKIGNLKENRLVDLLNSELYQKSIKEMPYFEICQKCGFRIRFMKEDV